jgi:mono/diheme cytochrome c family protein
MSRKSRKSKVARSAAPAGPGSKVWWILSGAIAALVVAIGAGIWSGLKPLADPGDTAQVALGGKVYAQFCGTCHGARLEGQPNWRIRLPSGRLPAPPHDDTGHTWHHPDQVLFDITKHGLVPPHAPRGYQSDMPGYSSVLADHQIWAVLAFIKSRWSGEALAARREMLSGR